MPDDEVALPPSWSSADNGNGARLAHVDHVFAEVFKRVLGPGRVGLGLRTRFSWLPGVPGGVDMPFRELDATASDLGEAIVEAEAHLGKTVAIVLARIEEGCFHVARSTNPVAALAEVGVALLPDLNNAELGRLFGVVARERWYRMRAGSHVVDLASLEGLLDAWNLGPSGVEHGPMTLTRHVDGTWVAAVPRWPAR